MSKHKRIESWKLEIAPERGRLLAQYPTLGLRELALIGCAAMDAGLTELLTSRLVGDKKKVEDFVGASGNADGPVGTLSAKIKLAAMVGLVDDSFAQAMDHIRAIRNRMAHRVNADAADPIVQKHARELWEVAVRIAKGFPSGSPLEGTYDGTESDVKAVLNVTFAMVEALLTVLHEKVRPLPTLVEQYDEAATFATVENREALAFLAVDVLETFPKLGLTHEEILRRLEKEFERVPEDASPDEGIKWLFTSFLNALPELEKADAVEDVFKGFPSVMVRLVRRAAAQTKT